MYFCEISCDNLTALLHYCHQHQINLYHIQSKRPFYYQFTIDSKNYSQIKKKFENLTCIQVIGWLRFILLYISSKYRLFGFLMGIIWFMFLNQLTYGCIVTCTYPRLTANINLLLDEYHLNDVNFKIDDIEGLEKEMYENVKNEIDYFDLYKIGKIYYLSCTPRLLAYENTASNLPLVSLYDAVVSKIEVSSGNVLVQEHQYVSKGQILVSNEILTTSDEVVLVDVKGEIYGYVYHTFEASCKGDLDVDTYLFLYQQISNLVSQQIAHNGKVVDEYVLQYTKKEGKIILKVQFVLYQNIAQKGFLNE